MTHFPSCKELKESENDFIDFVEFKEVISEMSEGFRTRFYDSDSLKPKLQLFITQWILKWPSNHSTFKWSCVIFS
jgi:hypothetical protein